LTGESCHGQRDSDDRNERGSGDDVNEATMHNELLSVTHWGGYVGDICSRSCFGAEDAYVLS
jgi:hypothetical protein